MSERAAPQYCPYCGDEDLRPAEGGHRRWACRSCRRVFEVGFVGLLAAGDGERAEGERPGQN
jgi:transposase-like protein